MPAPTLERRTAPTGAHGFAGAVAINLLVAGVFWLALTSEHGGDYDDLAYTDGYEDWLLPTSLFLTVVVTGGIFALRVQGWRRFGVGLIVGALTVGLVDLVWSFAYFISLGS